jgi:hypothetical protein
LSLCWLWESEQKLIESLEYIMSTPTFVQDVNGLSNMQIMRACPSVFAEEKHESRSARYTYIPTSQVLAGLAEAGFVPTTAMQARSRVEGKQDFTKHLLRLRKVGDLGYGKPDVHEIVLVNSHDGTSAYNLYGGVFRCVCTNGLITGDIDTTMKVYHRGDIVEQIVDSTLQIVEESEGVMETVAEMKSIELSRPEQLLLAEYSMKARFDLSEENKSVIPYQPADFLRVHRYEDRPADLYTTTNVVQENMLQGGVSRRDSQGKRHSTRQIRGIDQNVKVNKLIWQFSQELLKFKKS